MLIRQLEYLVALAREGHFARAAASCHVSQPGLSGAIHRLERELGVQIVRRGRRFEGFTPEGEHVVRWAQRMSADHDAMRQDLAQMSYGASGTLRIGAIPTALSATPLLVSPFVQKYPMARVSIESLTSQEIVRRLAEFDLDIGITYVDGEPLGPGVRIIPMYRERYLLLTPRNSEMASRVGVTWSEVGSLPLCLLPKTMQSRRILDRNFAAAGVDVDPVLEADTGAMLYAHVAACGWSTVVAHAWLPTSSLSDDVCVVPMAAPRYSHRIGIVLLEREPVPILIKALLETAETINFANELSVVLRRYIGTNVGEVDRRTR